MKNEYTKKEGRRTQGERSDAKPIFNCCNRSKSVAILIIRTYELMIRLHGTIFKMSSLFLKSKFNLVLKFSPVVTSLVVVTKTKKHPRKKIHFLSCSFPTNSYKRYLDKSEC